MLSRCIVTIFSVTWISYAVVAQEDATPLRSPSRVGEVVIIKFQGQHDVLVKVIQITNSNEGDAIAAVQDLNTGAQYSLPAAVVDVLPRTNAPANVSKQLVKAAVVTPPKRDGWPTTAATTLPGMTKPMPGTQVNAESRNTYVTPARYQDVPAANASTRTEKSPLYVTPGGHSYLAERRRLPDVLPAAQTPAQMPPRASIMEVGAQQPVALPKVLPDRVVDGPDAPALPIPPESVADRPTTAITSPPPVALLAPSIASLASIITDEIRPYATDLVSALRPSIRERAATALAEGRHGWRPEVKALLARAAMTDPAPTVQAHCIQLLSRLGYHESYYLEFLESSAGSSQELVRKRAREAIVRLAPR